MYLRDIGPSGRFICRTCLGKVPQDTLEAAFLKGLSSLEVGAEEILAELDSSAGTGRPVLLQEGGRISVSEVWPLLSRPEQCQLVDLLLPKVVVGPNEIAIRYSEIRPSGAQKPRSSNISLPSSRGSDVQVERPTKQGNRLRRVNLEDLLTVEEVAGILRTTTKAVYSMIDRGQLPGVTRLGRRLRIRRDDLLALFESRASSQKERRP